MSDFQEIPPGWIWQGLGWSAVLLLLVTVLVIGLISAGVFDPKPIGNLSDRQGLVAQTLPAQATSVGWLTGVAEAEAFSARLSAAHLSGESNVGYGLMIGGEQEYLAAAVSPLGYVAVWWQSPEYQAMLLPWQTWPHVRLDGATNEVQVDVKNNQVTVRVNREFLWQGEVPLSDRRVGWLGQSFGGAAVVQFQELRLYTPPK